MFQTLNVLVLVVCSCCGNWWLQARRYRLEEDAIKARQAAERVVASAGDGNDSAEDLVQVDFGGKLNPTVR